MKSRATQAKSVPPSQIGEPKSSDSQGKRQSFSQKKRTPSRFRSSSYYLALCLGAASALLMIAWIYSRLVPTSRKSVRQKPFVLAPLDVPLVTESSLFNASYREDMYWGTYRSGMYCGIRQREPRGLVAGLMWSEPTLDTFEGLRHQARQEDKLTTYGWIRHDMRRFGSQVIVDNGMRIETTFLKTPGAGYGGDWSLRVNVTNVPAPEKDQRNRQPRKRRLTQTFYIGDEELSGSPGNHTLSPMSNPVTVKNLVSHSGDRIAAGYSSHVGYWQLQAAATFDSEASKRTSLCGSAHFRTKEMHNLNDKIQASIRTRYMTMQPRPSLEVFDFLIGNVVEADPTTSVVQVDGEVPFSVDYVFTSGLKDQASGPESLEGQSLDAASKFAHLSGDTLTEKINESAQAFDDRFDRIAAQATSTQATHLITARAGLSNSLGSTGYFYGTSTVAMPSTESEESELRYTSPRPLFTGVPSRSFFPRGFLWDEGFHQLLVQQWDLRASCDVLAHWLDLINVNGWIPREQILGDEARSRVPSEYVAQLPAAANPPTLFLPIMKLASALMLTPESSASLLHSSAIQGDEVSKDDLADFLLRAWPRLSAWWSWFDDLQSGPEDNSFRWRGRVEDSTRELNPKTLASGLDDFPRASHPSSEERHLDLLSWMAFASQAMATIGEALNVTRKEVRFFQERASKLGSLANLKHHHWNDKHGMFLDWGLHTEDVKLGQVRVPGEFHSGGHPVYKDGRVETGSPPTPQFVPQFGYNSLFPVALTLLPADSQELGSQLSLLSQTDLLWTSHGLRSLSKSATLYNKRNTRDDPPYWRGAIWVNMNFLVIRSLQHYARIPGPHQKEAATLYTKLRNNLVNNIVKQYQRSDQAFLWENYSDRTGRGSGSHPFTGWTALVSLLVLQQY